MSRRTIRIAVAVGADAVTVCHGDSCVTHARESASLDEIFLRASGSVADGAKIMADVVLMPSLCEARLVALPPLKAQEAEAVIRRDVSKHFTVSNEPRVIGVRMPARGRSAGSSNAPVLAVAAAQRVMNEIAGAAERAGWSAAWVTAAHAAWLGAVPANARNDGRSMAVVAVDGDVAHAMRVEGGNPIELRRIPLRSGDSVAALLAEPVGTAVVLAHDTTRSAIATALSSRGWSVLPGASAAEAAARNAAASSLALRTDADIVRRAVQQRRLANRLAAAALVLVIAAAAIAHWGARRDVEALHARRLAIRERVQPLLAMRDSLDALDERARATDELFASQSRWSTTLYEITMLLPEDAHLTRINATGDTIVMEGDAVRAGDVLEAIGRAPSLRNAQMQGPVQRHLADGTTTSERFTIQATLKSARAAERPKRHVAATSTKAPSADAMDGVDGRRP